MGEGMPVFQRDQPFRGDAPAVPLKSLEPKLGIMHPFSPPIPPNPPAPPVAASGMPEDDPKKPSGDDILETIRAGMNAFSGNLDKFFGSEASKYWELYEQYKKESQIRRERERKEIEQAKAFLLASLGPEGSAPSRIRELEEENRGLTRAVARLQQELDRRSK